jgi:ketosteroid isomerase-like protein
LFHAWRRLAQRSSPVSTLAASYSTPKEGEVAGGGAFTGTGAVVMSTPRTDVQRARDTARAMSQENVEIVKRAQPRDIDMVELFRASNAPGGAVTPDTAGIDVTVFASDFEAEFISARAGSLRPASRGPEGLAEGWRDWLEPWESYYIELEKFIDAGDEVISLVRVRAQTTRDAVAVEHESAALWSVREGEISRVRFYLDRDQALEAAGLRE